jgi:hypothetical protein
MSRSLYEKVWFIAVIPFIAYPIGDILGYWDIQAPVVLLWSGALLLAGRKVGKRI